MAVVARLVPGGGATTMTLRRWMLLALVAAMVLGVGFVVLVAGVASVTADALAQVLAQVVWVLAVLSMIPYAIVYLIQLALLWGLPQVVLFIIEWWPCLMDCWKWLMGR